MLAGLMNLGCRMNVGKTLFAQVMEYVPWKTFGRIIERHKGDAGVRTLGCADLFRVMTFAQLTWRESLRDIETCLAANRAKLFHMGSRRRQRVPRWPSGCPPMWLGAQMTVHPRMRREHNSIRQISSCPCLP